MSKNESKISVELLNKLLSLDLAISARKEYEVSNGFHKNHGRKSA
jgi:hypothetical protein